MTRAINDYRIFYFGKPRSFSNQAAELARAHVSAYLQKAECVTVSPDKLLVKGEAIRDALEGLIGLGDHRDFFVVPLSNSELGDVYDFMPFHKFQMIAELDLQVVLVLCNQSGSPHDIKRIVTKNTAFQQVIDVLRKRGFDVKGLNGANEKSTSEGAEEAKHDSGKAAICSPEACSTNGLTQIGDVLGRRTTTFGIFVNELKSFQVSGQLHNQYAVLTRNAGLYTGQVPGGGKAEFVELLVKKQKLCIKWGVDPLSHKLHLGHLACLYKLQDFLNFNHKVVVVLGTFTGQIGDPSGNLTPRPWYESDELKTNADAIKKQIQCVLKNPDVRFEYNADLVDYLNLSRLFRWGYFIDHRLLLARSDFQQRVKNERSLSLSEMLYGLFQAHDTLVLNADVEVGGLDQLHNGILMRNVFRLENRLPAFVMLVPLLPGIDSQAKMSAFSQNEILITANRTEIRERLLQIQNLGDIVTYMRMLTDLDEQHISQLHVAFSDGSLPIDQLSTTMADAVLAKLNPKLEHLG